MTKDFASLQRRPFLTPIWLTVLGAICAIGILGFAIWGWGTADSTMVVVIRHAEKELDAGGDPPLSPAGVARAERLSRMFGDAAAAGHIEAIYVSPTVRNRMTAAPLAARLGLTPIVTTNSNPSSLARRVLREHAGGRVLVVGHSDTINEIVEALSGVRDLPVIGGAEYGTMYIVCVPRIGRANVLRVTY
jgi:phosphohistidine phosphatase SixA